MEDHGEIETRAEREAVFGLVMRHPGAWLPAIYLLASTVGLLDSWWFFRKFGINVFLYSDVADFLLASFREPSVWYLLALVIVVGLSDRLASLRVGASASPGRWLRWYGSPRYRRIALGVGVIYGLVYIAVFAGSRANAIYERRRGQEVRVVFANDSSPSETAVLLGSTLSFLFLYDPARGVASIHPYENVVTIETQVPRRAD